MCRSAAWWTCHMYGHRGRSNEGLLDNLRVGRTPGGHKVAVFRAAKELQQDLGHRL